MIKFYYHPSPNPAKVALFLEESGLPYEVVPVDTLKGEQFAASFVTINPNTKTPAITDGGVRVFDSTAILMYLAEKTGQFLPENTPKARAEPLSLPNTLDYAVNRYEFEARRHFGILDAQLADGPYLLGATYTIADMSAWGWTRAVPFILGGDAWGALPHLKRWFELINARPAAVRANALKDRYTFKLDVDAEARRHIFRHVTTT